MSSSFAQTPVETRGGTIYTVGHSNHPPERFFQLIKDAGIKGIADVRSIPASSRFPHFSKKKFERICSAWDVKYVWFGALGGKGQGVQENVKCCQGKQELQRLAQLAYMDDIQGYGSGQKWAMMCSEHDWRQCHRKDLSDILVEKGLDVVHILIDGSLEKHVIG
eukprot:TRINITY_DN9012_c1_g1_i2.p2 TRINITY_DN9012_c1_g1~~TRINITY_DN9012_c1_g1_i2.p2  ORF type:complete len:164 (-),score=13.48 TRINITY_DN9012_c1_g1_i2:272-763(-)